MSAKRGAIGWLALFALLMLISGLTTTFAQVDSPAYQAALKALKPHGRSLDPTKRWDVDTAIPKLEQALVGARKPADQAKINLLLGLLYYWDGQIDKAIAASEVVILYDPTLEASFPELKIHGLDAMACLGDCYRAKGDWATAIHWWEKVMELHPDAQAPMAMILYGRRKLGQVRQLTAGPIVIATGQYLQGDVREQRDRLLVSAPELAQRLGVVAKAGSPGQVELASDAHRLLLSAGSRHAVLDGATITLPVAPTMVKDKLLVPLRFVAEAFGHRVDWEPLPRIAWVR